MNLISRLRFPYSSDRLFSVVFFVAVFIPLAFSLYLPDGFEAVKLCLWLMATGGGLIILARQRQIQVGYQPALFVALGAFLLWALLATIFSLDRLNSLIGEYGRFTNSILFFGVWVLFIIFLLSTLTREKYTFLLKTLVAVSGFIALFGILQSVGLAFYAGLNAPLRPLIPSFLGNPNFSSMFIVGLLPFALIFAYKAQSRSSKIYYVSASVAIIWAVMIFSSRGSILALFAELAIAAVLLLVSRFSARGVIYFFLAIVLSGLFFGGFFYLYRPDTLQLSDTTIQTRFEVWDEALHIIKSRPLLGTGLGNFTLAFQLNRNASFANSEIFDDAHNLLLHLAATGGIPLLIFFLTIIGISVYYGWYSLWRQRDALAAAGLAGLIGLLIAAGFNPMVVACWMLLAVFIAGLVMNKSKEFIFVPRAGGKALLWIAGLAAIILPVVFIASEYLTYAGQLAYKSGNIKKTYSLSRAAVILNPLNATALTYKAAAQIKSGQSTQAAEQTINQYIKLHPNISGTYGFASTLYYLLYKQTGDVKYLTKDYQLIEQAITLAPNYAGLQGRAAYMYFKAGDLAKAQASLEKSLPLGSSSFYNWVLLGKVYQLQGRKDEALFALEKAYKLSPILYLKQVMADMRASSDVTKVTSFGVIFPEPDIQ